MKHEHESVLQQCQQPAEYRRQGQRAEEQQQALPDGEADAEPEAVDVQPERSLRVDGLLKERAEALDVLQEVKGNRLIDAT